MAKDIGTLTFDTFSDLRNVSGSQSASVTVLGKDSINDGFGGKFYWDATSTTPDNNISIIQKTGLNPGRWIRSSTLTDTNLSQFQATQNLQAVTNLGNSTTKTLVVRGLSDPISGIPSGLSFCKDGIFAGDSLTNDNILYSTVNEGQHIFYKRFGDNTTQAAWIQGQLQVYPGTDPDHAVTVSQLTSASNLQAVTTNGHTTNKPITSTFNIPDGTTPLESGLTLANNRIAAGGSGDQNVNYTTYNNGKHVFGYRGVQTSFGDAIVIASFSGAVEATDADQPNQLVTLGQTTSLVTGLRTIVASYSAMIALATGTKPIDFLVLNDENKSQQNTTYQFYPDPTSPVLMWVASIKENI